MFGLGKRNTADGDMVGRYRRWRSVGKELNKRLVRNMGDGVLEKGARALGIIKDKTMMFDTEDQMDVLMDFCIHYVYLGGKNAAERYLQEGEPSEEERAVLEGMGRSRFAVFTIVRAERGVGIEVEDVYRKDRLFVVDVNLSQTGRAGLMMASRLYPMEDFWMTSGAGLAVSGEAAEALKLRLAAWVEDNAPDWGNLTREQVSSFARVVVRTCLRKSQDTELAYADLEEGGDSAGPREWPVSREMPVSRGSRVGRNEPCPCGSGRKYKKCCGAGAGG